MKEPNKETTEALNEDLSNAKKYDNVEDAMADALMSDEKLIKCLREHGFAWLRDAADRLESLKAINTKLEKANALNHEMLIVDIKLIDEYKEESQQLKAQIEELEEWKEKCFLLGPKLHGMAAGRNVDKITYETIIETLNEDLEKTKEEGVEMQKEIESLKKKVRELLEK